MIEVAEHGVGPRGGHLSKSLKRAAARQAVD